MSITVSNHPQLPLIRVNEDGIVKLIDKNIVVLYHEKAYRIFHTLIFKEPISDDFLKQTKVIYIDCKSHRESLFKNNWEWDIEQRLNKNVYELSNKTPLANKLINQVTVPNKAYLSLYG